MNRKVYKTIAYHQIRKGEDIIRVVGQEYGFTAIRKDLNPFASMFTFIWDCVYRGYNYIHYGNVDMPLMVCEHA